MTLSLTHTLVSAVVDNGVAGEVGPSEWNDQHVITMATAKVLGRTTAGTGVVEELSVSGLGSTVALSDTPAFTGTTMTITYTDAGAGAGPYLQLIRDSASPAASDTIGQIIAYGRNSAASLIAYGADTWLIQDATNGSEDADRQFYTRVAGAFTLMGYISATGWNGMDIGQSAPGKGAFTKLNLSAGTTAIAPINFTTGTNLTTAAAGAMEWDGTCLYFTNWASSRGVSTIKQVVSNGSVVALSNSSVAAQNVFPSANDTLTLPASTTFRFRGRIGLNTGATTHVTSLGFGGTATFTSINYITQAISSAAGALATTQMRRISSAAAAAVTATSVAVQTEIWFDGIMRINGAGTIIPQITFSAGPTGTCEVAIDSFFELEPIGSNTFAAIGNWS